ncbi:MAG: CocE/NonD family hydrolase [Bryobacteraceae bacterium]
MRDGVRLCTNVFRPSIVARGPVLLVRTPYGKQSVLTPNYQFFVDQGYTVVIQDVRGRYDSEGRFTPVSQETADGEDTLNWVGRQPWCDGNVGMMGGSYVGITQWRAALGNSPYLKAIFPVMAGSDDYLDRYYSPGGALKLGHRLEWIAENMKPAGFTPPPFRTIVDHLPLRTSDVTAAGRIVDYYQQALNHPTYDTYWKEQSTYRSLGRVKTPAFIVAGWYDNYAQSDLAAYSKLREKYPSSRIVIGPWPHNMSMQFTGTDFGSDSMAPIRTYQLRWFDYWLRGRGSPERSESPVQVFVMGENRWRGLRQWPPETAEMTPFFLDSGGRANTLDGDGQLHRHAPRVPEDDDFIYDPRDPTPTQGGAVCCNDVVLPWGPMNQQAVERRKDVLVYTSRPLREDLEVIGPVRAVLYVSSSAPDTDFTAKLVDVFPDGQARNLTDGILRLRYRKGLEQAELMTPGRVYPVTIDVGVTANVFQAGHRIRLEVSSSNFPRFDRNPNTGRAMAGETELRTARQKLWHGPQRPSHLLLPVIPRSNAKLTYPVRAGYLGKEPHFKAR